MEKQTLSKEANILVEEYARKALTMASMLIPATEEFSQVNLTLNVLTCALTIIVKTCIPKETHKQAVEYISAQMLANLENTEFMRESD